MFNFYQLQQYLITYLLEKYQSEAPFIVLNDNERIKTDE